MHLIKMIMAKYKTPNEAVKEGFHAAEERLRKALTERNITLAYAIAMDMKKYFDAFDLRNAAVEFMLKDAERGEQDGR